MTKVSRRSLFDAFRAPATREPAQPAAAPGFSLDAFYAGRGAAAPLPSAPLRPGLPAVPTTRVGLGAARAPGRAAGHAVVIPEGGRVRVRAHTCLALTGSFCSTCSERCPVPGAIVVEAGRPRVDEDVCTGCGVCVGLCPAPINGFDIVLPRRGPRGDV